MKALGVGAAIALACAALLADSASAQLEEKPPILVQLGTVDGPVVPGTLADIPFLVTLQCSDFFQPAPGSEMEVTYNVTLSDPVGFAFTDPPNATLPADFVNCTPGGEAQTNGTLTLLLAKAPAFTELTMTLDVAVDSGDKDDSASNATTVEVGFTKSLTVSVGNDRATVPPGGNLTVKVNVVNDGNAPVTATVGLADFGGTGSLTRESFVVTLPAGREIGMSSAANVAVFEVKVQTPSGGLFVGEEGTFTFNVTAHPTERPDLDGGSGEVEYKVLVQGTKKKGDGGKDSPAASPLWILAAVCAALIAGRRRFR